MLTDKEAGRIAKMVIFAVGYGASRSTVKNIILNRGRWDINAKG